MVVAVVLATDASRPWSTRIWVRLRCFVTLMAFLFLSSSLHVVDAVPKGFIDEGIIDLTVITGAFAPNPRNGNKPMLLLSSKEGLVYALEDPDNSDKQVQIGDLRSKMCTNGERGLQTILPHPDFAKNRFLFMYYTASREGCQEDAKEGPSNRLSRFTVNAGSSLQIDIASETVLLETPPAPKRMHNGGAMAFGNDGLLYVLTGDAGSREPRYSQDMRNLYGKVLRLDVSSGSNTAVVPSSNPYVKKGVSCAQSKGRPPSGTASDKVCSEIFAAGLRNPFRMAMDVDTTDKVRFAIGDVGASLWEEMSLGGSDMAGTNYAWPQYEGPCENASTQKCAPLGKAFTEPFYYYQHTKSEEGGAVTGAVFVPNSVGWPSEYNYLFIDYVFGKIYNLVEDKGRECRSCTPPRPGYRNETFHNHKDMVDMFFGPYKGGQALYVVSRSDGQNVRRIRFTDSSNRAPIAVMKPSDAIVRVSVNQAIAFDGSASSDPDGDAITLAWDFGDGTTSTNAKFTKSYNKAGEYLVELIVTDSKKQTNQVSITVAVGAPPKATIESPAAGVEFVVGQVLRLQGSGTDATGKALDKSQLFWEVKQHHANHFHPFLDRTAGNDFDLQAAPEPEDFIAATNSYLEIILYAVDANGVSASVSRKVMPKKVLIDVSSVVPGGGGASGLTVFLDEFPVETPATITSWENHSLRLNVNDQGSNVFQSWSTGGARKSVFRVPAAGATNPKLTATFGNNGMPSPPTPVAKPPVPSVPTSPTTKIPLNRIVRFCSSAKPCGRCEGTCFSDTDCNGNLVCFKKDAGVAGVDSVPGCIGSDLSKTDWCILPQSSNPKPPVPAVSTPTKPQPVPTTPTTAGIIPLSDKVRTCSATSPCGRCEGHCKNDDDCSGSLVCFQAKSATDSAVPGCFGIDFSRTDWCVSSGAAVPVPTVPKPQPVPRPVPTPTRPSPTGGGGDNSIPLVRVVRNCTPTNPCRRCEGNCENDNECQGSLVCFSKDAGRPGQDAVPGCIGADLSRTDWCTVATSNEQGNNPRPVAVPVAVPVPIVKPNSGGGIKAIPLRKTIRTCSAKKPCGQCEGNCSTDDDCEGRMICFKKDAGKPGKDSVPNCIGTDLSKTDWCTFK